ncbi:MAG: histidinol-phosphate aminotransferase family protein [Anaerolineales bacterium]|nr:histidinol-phosphate aminotransferase family protein [Anaerolineales bacterium]
MKKNIDPRPEVTALEPDHHGGPDYTELEQLGIRPESLLDFSVNSNPYGPPPGIQNLYNDLIIKRYPDRECLKLRAALARYHRRSMDQIWAGNGAAELIWTISLAFLSAGDRVLVVTPTFGEYAAGAALMGARIETFPTCEQHGFIPDIPALKKRIKDYCPRVTFICNPNNPTGVYLEQADMESLIDQDGLVVIDEAYIDFVADRWELAPLLESGNLILLCSMTKSHAIPGLRLGYLLADALIINAIRKTQPPWSVNALAQQAGILAIQNFKYLETTMEQLALAKKRLFRDLTALGLKVLPSSTNYFLINVGNAWEIRTKLIHKGILVRDCSSFNLPSHIRIATLKPDENETLVTGLRSILSEIKSFTKGAYLNGSQMEAA